MLNHGSKKNMLPSSRPVAFIYNLNIKEQGFCAGCKLFAQNRNNTCGESLVTKRGHPLSMYAKFSEKLTLLT